MSRQLAQVEPHELAAVGWSFAWFFCVLCAYFILRPVRETMGVAGGTEELRWLFLAVFLVMLVASPLYSALVARVSRRVLVPIVYRFFVVFLLGFALAISRNGATPGPWLGRTFFVWISVFNLFVVSVFWSFLADIFTSGQAKRLFGLVAAGGTAGAISGSLVASQSVELLGIGPLLLLPALLLELALYAMRRLDVEGRQMRTTSAPPDVASRPTGGGPLEGMLHVARSPYLLGICGFLLLGMLFSTTVYFQQAEIVKRTVADRTERTELFANINLVVQLITLGLQTIVVGPLMRRAGLALTLCVLPTIYLFGFVGLGLLSILPVLIAVEISQRAVGYGVTAPAREVLFTVVSRADKYKSKNFIDTVVVRGGDTLAAQINGGLLKLGLTLQQIALAMVPLTLLWAALAWQLGRRQTQIATGDPTLT